MARLYLIRHGQTLFNVLRRKQGWCDSPLTELGIQQAKDTGIWFKDHNISFDHVYSSTSERACDTAELIAPNQSCVRLKGLKEFNFGRFEGLTEDVNGPIPPGDFYVAFGGEGEMQVRERIMATLHQIMDQPDHTSVLAVSHGAACAQVCRALNFDFMQSGKHLGNCCILELEYSAYPAPAFKFCNLINPHAEPLASS